MGRLIDIDRLCNDLAKRWSIADKKKEDTIRAVMADVVTPIVVSQPTVDAVPVVHGRWETVEDWDGDEHYQCSVCGAEFVLIDGDPDDNDYLYCPHCGARMDERGDGDG